MGSIMKTAYCDGLWRLLLRAPWLVPLGTLPVRAGEGHLLSVKDAIGPASANCGYARRTREKSPTPSVMPCPARNSRPKAARDCSPSATAGPAVLAALESVLGHVELAVSDLLIWRFWTEDLPDLWRLWPMIDLLLAERAA